MQHQGSLFSVVAADGTPGSVVSGSLDALTAIPDGPAQQPSLRNSQTLRSSRQTVPSSLIRASIGDGMGPTTAIEIVRNSCQNLKAFAEPSLIEYRGKNEYHPQILRYFFQVRGSILSWKLFVPVAVWVIWCTFWIVMLQRQLLPILPFSPNYISVIAVPLSLLMGYRINSSYDRYWEGRKLWSVLRTQSRNIARCVITGFDVTKLDEVVEPKEEKTAEDPQNPQTEPSPEDDLKLRSVALGFINLILAFSVALKHHVRGEKGIAFKDLAHLLAHVPEFHPDAKFESINVPLKIAFHMASFSKLARADDRLDLQCYIAINNSISTIVDCLSSMERIKDTPIPLAYSIHLKHCLTIYILSLPFFCASLGYLSIVVVALASFIFLGIETVAVQIQSPFGFDVGDLDIEAFVRDTRMELSLLSQEIGTTIWAGRRSPERWSVSTASA